MVQLKNLDKYLAEISTSNYKEISQNINSEIQDVVATSEDESINRSSIILELLSDSICFDGKQGPQLLEYAEPILSKIYDLEKDTTTLDVIPDLIDQFFDNFNEIEQDSNNIQHLNLLFLTLCVAFNSDTDDPDQYFLQTFLIQFILKSSTKSDRNKHIISQSPGILHIVSNKIIDTEYDEFVAKLFIHLSESKLRPIELLKIIHHISEPKSIEKTQNVTSLLSSLIDIQTTNHLHFKDSAVELTVTQKIPIFGYTYQFWVKFNYTKSFTLFTDTTGTQVRLEDGKLFLYHRSRLVGKFDGFQFEECRYYHIVFLHQLSRSSSGSTMRAKIKLYVDGEFVEQIRCIYSLKDRSQFESSGDGFQATVSLGSAKCDFNLSNFLMLNEIQPTEWILMSFYLGVDYNGDYSDDNLMRFLNTFDRTRFNLRLLEVLNNTDGDIGLEDLALKVEKNNLLMNIRAGIESEFLRVGDDMLVSLDSSKAKVTGNIFSYTSQSTHEVFYSIGGIQLLLKLIESSQNMESLFQSTSVLLKLINTNWKFVIEMETLNGYQILSTLLKVKKAEFRENLNINFLDLILGFVGYNSLSPFNSTISNPLAYECLILDFNLWKPIDDESKPENLKLVKFLIFQFTVFTRECKYSTFNVLKLKKLKVVKRILNFLSQGYFSEDMEEILFDTLLLLMKSNLTSDNVKSLSSFVVYSLNEGNEFTATLVLKVLATVFLDPLISNINYWKKLFSTVSVKWILLVIQLGNKNKVIVDTTLTLILKIFLMTSKSYDIFLKNNGLKILFSALRDVKFDKVETNVLVKGSFGQYQYDLNFSKLDAEVSDLITTYDSLVIPELHYLILDSLEWTVLNDIFKADSHDKISQLIDSYINFLSRASEELKSTERFFQNDKLFINKLCNLIILLTKPQNTTIYFDSSEKIVQFLSRIILSKLFKGDPNALESYINTFLMKSEDQTSDATKTLFLSLVFPKVIVHLQEFSSEFEVLFTTGGVELSSLAVFLNFMNEKLLDFEWNLKDYFNYLTVLLDIIEAYKNSNKNTKGGSFINIKKNITNATTVLMYVLTGTDSVEQTENFLKILLFHQQNLFDVGCLTNDCVSNLVCFLLEISTMGHSVTTSLALNCLRILLMRRQHDLASICSSITFKNYNSTSRFLDAILSVNDEDLVHQLETDTKLRTTFKSHLDGFANKITKRLTKQQRETSEQKMTDLFVKHDQFIKIKYENIEALSKLLKNDNEVLRVKVVSNEANRLSRHAQDQQDNLQFYITSFNKLKLDTSKFINTNFNTEELNKRWTLDYMEGSDRMRKRLLPYDDLASDQKVNFSIEVPVKQAVKDVQNGHPKVESLSLNSFELIENDLADESIGTYNDKNRKVLKSLFSGDRIQELWNVSQVVGLEINEGILILGQTHIYLIQNYFHKSENDEIIDIDDAPDSERDPNVKLISGQPRPKTSEIKTVDNHSVQSWDLGKLTSVTKRQFLLRDVALEMFFSNGSSFLITSIKTKDRDAIYVKLSTVATNSNIDSDLSAIFKETNLNSTSGLTGRNLSIKLASVFGADYINYLEATKKWQRGEMSNFYYLMILNTLAGRTFNDLTQYPIFPWVIADYTSDELDLSNPSNFRDLSKPMGAQTPQRAAQFKERYEALQSLDDEESPAFHYGTHYSSAMIVASFLIRLEPFVQSYLLLQGGKFDHADRLFYSIEKAWNSASRENTTDVRELIPEFYFLPEFLTNLNKYEFGKLQDGTEISDVELPKWAHGDPKIFIEKNKEALESPYVSEHLHEWIDLIFGFKQLGQEAVDALNVFNYLSYHGAIDLDKIDNEIERRSITGIIHNFGQTPLQVFNKPHPIKDVTSLVRLKYEKIKKAPTLIYQTKFHSPIHYLQFKTHSDNSGDAFWRGYPKLFLNGDSEIKQGTSKGSMVINRKSYERLHDDDITVLAKVNDDIIITASSNGVIHIWHHNVIIKTINEQLEFETQLRAHLYEIVELKVSPEYNLLLSLDSEGNCYLWDLARYKFIRKISSNCDHVAISYDSGMISTSVGSTLQLFTINGELICSKEFDITDSTITCLNFATSRKLGNFNKSQNVECHEYWSEIGIILTGWSNGDIKLDELAVNSQGEWGLQEKGHIRFNNEKDSKHENEEISIVEAYLKSYVNHEGERIGNVEIVAGDVNGRVAVWR
ncbi:hypothetical protein WICANDRAFT_76929 [Wickerhamomyces anomalus NRRL Y-366-8]|uniref:Beige protein homolog 1 n=1 Tax=Wickerhamomyces anomalus (strain ATCC 58044 / CBS 1984 / NCYC 433 / NRRL Y-366-8) TaxID=683960 RepID=A0A1E3PBI9_WICAA|nr:uncharacterized protein WICANDRAFT_76929 [Wickerhamomyces anomalus NRRL Y-366-8]ODQ62765.1 hypothetical protein WICANDRAFT_76929 [Wickerhamomyces anomalus NRRL Y-366-8]